MRLAIVTGGSRGLGFALCEQLLSAGYQVIEFSRAAAHSYSVQLDLGDPESVEPRLAEALGSVDSMNLAELLVISNAGTLEPIGPAGRKSAHSVISNLNANLVSPILLISAVVERFRESLCRKVIANISSGAALKSYAGWSLYCASKAGMESFLRTLAIEQQAASQPFLAVNIDPGVIDTEMQARIRESSPDDFPEVARFIKRKLVGGLAAPADVAEAILEIVNRHLLEPGRRYEVEFG